MLGSVLRAYRESAGLSQEEVGVRAGITREWVNQVENDRASPTVDVFIRICQAIGVRASDILAEIEDSI